MGAYFMYNVRGYVRFVVVFWKFLGVGGAQSAVYGVGCVCNVDDGEIGALLFYGWIVYVENWMEFSGMFEGQKEVIIIIIQVQFNLTR